MSGRHRRSLIALALITASVAIVGVASATSHTSDQTYTACLTKSGNLANVAVGKEPRKPCSTKDTEVSWSSQGPMGPQGPAGADGTDGAPGADGTDGTPGADGTDGAPGADGTDGADGAEYGPIVMTTSGNSWLAQGINADVTPFARWATETTFFAPVSAVISLTGPGAMNGVDYGLESFDLCVITDSNNVSSVSVTGIAPFRDDVNSDQYLDLFRVFPSPGLTTGCHTFVVNAAVGQGAGLMVEVTGGSNGSPVTLESVSSVWTPEAAQE